MQLRLELVFTLTKSVAVIGEVAVRANHPQLFTKLLPPDAGHDSVVVGDYRITVQNNQVVFGVHVRLFGQDVSSSIDYRF
ncbi:hypothetical protein D3C78_1863050 [compost metagenome]